MPSEKPAARCAWDEAALDDPHRLNDKARRVEAMFNAIAPRYELVNRVATLGLDAAWRRRAVAAATVTPTDVVLDVACGTGDMMRAFAAGRPAPARILGLDFAAEMLSTGLKRGMPARAALVRGDAQRMPLADESVDVVSCAFGVRNFQDLSAGLGEMRRVLRAGGRLVILEFATPTHALWRVPYRLYCEVVVPRLGALLGRDRVGAYRYLPRSVATFDSREAMERRLAEAGFAEPRSTAMNFGGVVLYRCVRG